RERGERALPLPEPRQQPVRAGVDHRRELHTHALGEEADRDRGAVDHRLLRVPGLRAPGWATSEAHAFCQALRIKLIQCLPGYSDAPWEWTEQHGGRPSTFQRLI